MTTNNTTSYVSRKLTIEENFNYLVHFHSLFLRSFDELLAHYRQQHYGKYEDIQIQHSDEGLMNSQYEETMLKAEETLERIEQRYKINLSLENIMSDMFVELDQMKQRLHMLLLECGKDNMYLMNKNEELIDVLSFCQQSISGSDDGESIQSKDEETFDRYRNIFNQVIENIVIPNCLHEYFVQEQVDKLKEWIGLSFETILFDSNFITLNSKNIFTKMIINKEHLLFLLEDEQHNKFGGYLHTYLDKHDQWIVDPLAFIFSITSNGRLQGMQRFALDDPQHAFYLSSSMDDPVLFMFGSHQEIQVNVLSQNQPSYSHFSLGPMMNILTGKSHFIPQRLIIIEMK